MKSSSTVAHTAHLCLFLLMSSFKRFTLHYAPFSFLVKTLLTQINLYLSNLTTRRPLKWFPAVRRCSPAHFPAILPACLPPSIVAAAACCAEPAGRQGQRCPLPAAALWKLWRLSAQLTANSDGQLPGRPHGRCSSRTRSYAMEPLLMQWKP